MFDQSNNWKVRKPVPGLQTRIQTHFASKLLIFSSFPIPYDCSNHSFFQVELFVHRAVDHLHHLLDYFHWPQSWLQKEIPNSPIDWFCNKSSLLIYLPFVRNFLFLPLFFSIIKRCIPHHRIYLLFSESISYSIALFVSFFLPRCIFFNIFFTLSTSTCTSSSSSPPFPSFSPPIFSLPLFCLL